MSDHEFERVDKIVAKLAAEMDACMEKQMCRHNHKSGDFRQAMPRDPECVVDGPVWIKHRNLNDLFERMNERFEVMAQKLRLADRRLQ